MGLKLYIGVGPYPIHEQHKEVMGLYGEDWLLIDKHVKQSGTLNYGAFELPYDQGTVDVIYSSHLLEHIPHVDVLKGLRYWTSLLKAGGILHLNVPDMEWACTAFLELLKNERTGIKTEGYFNKSIDYQKPGRDFLQIFYGSQLHDGEFHCSGFTKEALENLLASCGYVNIQIRQEVEAHEMGCLIATATKGNTLQQLKSRILG